MKKIIILLVLLVLFTGFVYAEGNALTIGMGLSYPFGNEIGTSFLINYGKDYDESVFYGFGANFAFTKINWSEDFATVSEKSDGFLLPTYGLIRVRFDIPVPFSVFMKGGMGTSFYFDKVQSISDPNKDATMSYFGFYWQIGFGMGMMLGTKTDGEINFEFSSSSLNKIGGVSSDYPNAEDIQFYTIKIMFTIRFFHM